MTSTYLASTITNYSETIRTNVNTAPQGLQTFCLELDEIGFPIGYTEYLLRSYGSSHTGLDFDVSALQNYWSEVITNGHIIQSGMHDGQSEMYVDGVYDTQVPFPPEGEPATLKYYSIFTNSDLYNRNGRYIYLQGVLQW